MCAAGTQTCTAAGPFCEQNNVPIEEVCNDLDDNCDGVTDNTCLVGGTPIAMADGTTRPIEQVAVGDWVLSYDFAREQVVPAPVVRTFVHPAHELSESIVRINSDLRATTNHPIYANGRWVPAGLLNVGDSLFLLSSDRETSLSALLQTRVASLSTEREREATFNLEIGAHHNYFAGDVLVHNKEFCPQP